MADWVINARAKKAQLLEAGNAIMNRCQAGNRVMNAQENSEYERILTEVKDINARIERNDEITAAAHGWTKPDGRREGNAFDVDRATARAKMAEYLGKLSAYYGGRISNSDLTSTTYGSSGIPDEVSSIYFEQIYATDLLTLCGVQVRSRTQEGAIFPLQIPMPVSATVVGQVTENTDPGSAVPDARFVTLNGTKIMAYTALTLEARAKLLRSADTPYNPELAELVLTCLFKGKIQEENKIFLNTLLTQLGGNAHAVSVYNDGDLVSLFARLQSTLSLQYRQRAVWLIGQAGESIIRSAKDTLGRPLFDLSDGRLNGKPFVVSPDLAGDTIIYGDHFSGSFASRSGFITQTLTEVSALTGKVAYMGYEFFDIQTFASVSSDVTRQPLLMTSLLSGASS